MLPVQWPHDTPAEVRGLADDLATTVHGCPGPIAGPALLLVLAYTIAELGGSPLGEILVDLGVVARRHGA